MRNLDEEQTGETQVIEPAEPLTELGEIKAELEALRAQLSEKDTREADFVSYENAKRLNVSDLPKDPAAIRDLVRKHALQQVEGCRRNEPTVNLHLETIANQAVKIVELHPKYIALDTGNSDPIYRGSNTKPDYERAVRELRNACRLIGGVEKSIMPIFSFIEPW